MILCKQRNLISVVLNSSRMYSIKDDFECVNKMNGKVAMDYSATGFEWMKFHLIIFSISMPIKWITKDEHKIEIGMGCENNAIRNH